MIEYIRDKYLPFIVKEVLKKYVPKTEEEFIGFCQAMYDKLIKKEDELMDMFDDKLN